MALHGWNTSRLGESDALYRAITEPRGFSAAPGPPCAAIAKRVTSARDRSNQRSALDAVTVQRRRSSRGSPIVRPTVTGSGETKFLYAPDSRVRVFAIPTTPQAQCWQLLARAQQRPPRQLQELPYVRSNHRKTRRFLRLLP